MRLPCARGKLAGARIIESEEEHFVNSYPAIRHTASPVDLGVKVDDTGVFSPRLGITVKVNAHSGGKPNGIPAKVNSSRSAATLTW
jgi:hypothetical protein